MSLPKWMCVLFFHIHSKITKTELKIKKMNKKQFLLAPLVLLFSCATELYQPINGTEKIALQDLKEGRAIYVNKCATCHPLRLPNQYNNKEWEVNLNKMQIKAKITNKEKRLVYQYLINAPKK